MPRWTSGRPSRESSGRDSKPAQYYTANCSRKASTRITCAVQFWHGPSDYYGNVAIYYVTGQYGGRRLDRQLHDSLGQRPVLLPLGAPAAMRDPYTSRHLVTEAQLQTAISSSPPGGFASLRLVRHRPPKSAADVDRCAHRRRAAGASAPRSFTNGVHCCRSQ